MAELTLPANSRVREGKRHAGKGAAKKPKVFQVYRWSPNAGETPRVDSYC